MAVQFILGRSGTGKTSYCIKAVVNALLEGSEEPLILLVPEQATYQAERAILGDERIAGYNRLHVLSFDRLQFLLLGKNTARPGISRIGRQMIIHRILRDNKSKLKLFGSSADRPGLARQMAKTITELHQYAKTPDDIEQLLGELQKDERNSLAALKFGDIGLILDEYLRFIEGRFLDPDVQLTRACRAVADADFVKGAKLWVDGFAGFTTAELAILSELLKATEHSQIALCLDASEIDPARPDSGSIDPAALFYPTQHTYAELVERIKASRLELAEPIILEQPVRFSRCPQLTHIESGASEHAPARITAASNVRVISAPNERAEVRFVARQIMQLAKQNGYRYRDIAVIASDIERYQHYVEAYFTDYAVPFFIDRRRPLNQHPVIGLICSALHAATGGFSNSDIFAYLKTDLVPIDRFEVDLLENYCIAFGITACDWQSQKQWRFARCDDETFDEQRINKVREEVMRPLGEFRERLCPAGNSGKTIDVGEFTRAIFDFLGALKVSETIASWIKQAQQNNNSAAVDEHQQFYGKLVDVFDELAEVFAGAAMTAEDYLAIVSLAFSQLTLAFIPPTLDQVLVGSIERSRHPDLKAVFLIGATQRQFPTPFGADTILTDDDRSAAESADFQLAPTARRTLAEHRYLAYIAFTRPSEFLCVTYPAVDEKGGAVPRSQFVAELEKRFEDLEEESIAREQGDIESIHNTIELTDLLCNRLGKDALAAKSKDDAHLGELLGEICSDRRLADAGATVVRALSYDNRAQLQGKTVTELFGKQLNSSATKLSTFAACPYQHFARYVLELKEREEFKFEPLDLGNFYHRVLDALLKQLKAQGQDFATIEDERLLEVLRGRIAGLRAEDPFISNFDHRSQHNTFIINSAGEVLEDCVLAISRMVRAGIFKPVLSEVSFGRAKDARQTLGEYELALGDGRILSLSGKIDRVDIAKLGDKDVAIVFDYKRSKRSATFSWTNFYHGLDMQLPIYMLAIGNAPGGQDTVGQVVGAFYMPVEISPQSATLSELPGKAQAFNYKAKGIFNGKFYRQLDGTADAGWSNFYSFRLSAKDEQYGNYGISAALKPNDFDTILKFAGQKLVQLAREILAGKIDVRPYRIGTASPCGYCKYKSVCRFDWQINDYNPLVSLGKTAVLEKMGGADG